jgi:hypothetical protein
VPLAWLTDLGIALARAGAPAWDEAALATALAFVVVAGAVHVGRIALGDVRGLAPLLAISPTHRAGSLGGGQAGATRPAPLLYVLSVVRR